MSVEQPQTAPATRSRAKGRTALRLRHQVQLGEHASALAWSTSGDVAVAATLDGGVHAIPLAAPAPPRLLAEHPGGALDVDVSDDDVVASGGQDGRARLVSLAGSRAVTELDGGGPWVEHVRWAPAGGRLVTAAGRVVRFWTSEGKLTGEFDKHPGSVTAIWWHASGQTLTTACADGLRLLSPLRRRAQVHIPWDAAGSVLDAAESPDARYIAMAHLGGTLSVLQLKTSRSIQFGGFPGKIRRLAWSHDSRRLAVASGEKVAVFGFSPRGPDRERARVLRGHPGRVAALAFFATPGGHLLASGCEAGRLLLWAEARDLRRTGALELGASIEQLFVSPDGGSLGVACRGGDVRIFSTAG
jgi:WD40 repeat protein